MEYFREKNCVELFYNLSECGVAAFFIRRDALLVYAGTANAVIHSSTFFFFARRFLIPLHGDYHM